MTEWRPELKSYMFLTWLVVFSWGELSAEKRQDSPSRAAPVVKAAIQIKGNRTLHAGTMKEAALVHSNRDYRFTDVPKEILGLRYVLHEHKRPANLSITMDTPGTLYLCLCEQLPGAASSRPSPSGLKLAGEWTEVGNMKTEAVGEMHTWAIYRAAIKDRKPIRIPSANKWGSVILASSIKGLQKAAVSNPMTAVESANAEFNLIQKQIQARRPGDPAQARVAEEVFRKEALILGTDKTPVDVAQRRTEALLQHISALDGAPDLAKEAVELEGLRGESSAVLSPDQQIALFEKITALRRRIAFKNPLLDFDSIIFLKHNKQARGERHMVDQYLGFNQAKGGGVYVLENAFGEGQAVKSLLAESAVQKGRLKGQKLEDSGSFVSLDLDYDGKTILFAFTEAEHTIPENASYENQRWAKDQVRRVRHARHYYFRPKSTYHVFQAGADGSNLRQLTDGMWDDYDPFFLPSGRIGFISERAGGNQRCGNRPLPSATLFAMMPDGSDLVQLSWHDTNEWHPSVDNNGMIVYTRWDYVDRDSDVAHHIWHCFPDGRDPRSYHGNYPIRRESRPWMEMSIRAIPNSHRYVAVATPHHGQNYGSLVMIDLRLKDDGSTAQLKRITPELQFPESESSPGKAHGKGTHRPRAEVCGTPWPLSEDFYLCVYDPAQRNYGLYLLDSFGNRELLYRDPRISCLDPIPLKARKRPPAIPTQTMQAKADQPEDADLSTGTVSIMNIYESELPWPEGTSIQELRIVNVFPKHNSFVDEPRIGHANQSLARGVLGTVPVEEDGSVHFKMPAGAGVYFQALDENGMAVQTMRSDTYLHPGETLSCIGCHESSHTAPKLNGSKTPMAMLRPPSKIEPEAEGSYPLTFPRLVQPVIDAKCVSCHDKEKTAKSLRGDKLGKYGWSEAFHTLRKYAWGKSGGNGAIRANGRSYSIPGQDGARVSKLYQMLAKGHHETKLTPAEMRRITLWLDCNSNFYGAYREAVKQARGEVIKPTWGVPRWTDFESLVR